MHTREKKVHIRTKPPNQCNNYEWKRNNWFEKYQISLNLNIGFDGFVQVLSEQLFIVIVIVTFDTGLFAVFVNSTTQNQLSIQHTLLVLRHFWPICFSFNAIITVARLKVKHLWFNNSTNDVNSCTTVHIHNNKYTTSCFFGRKVCNGNY